MTIRNVMVLVAVLGIALAVGLRVFAWKQFRAQCWREIAQATARVNFARVRLTGAEGQAKWHRERAQQARAELADPKYRDPTWSEWLKTDDPLLARFHARQAQQQTEQVEHLRVVVAYWQARRERWADALDHPWRPVAPDPPEPVDPITFGR